MFSPAWAAPAVSLSSEDLHRAENSDNRREKLRKANKRGIRGRGEKRCLRRRITCWVNGGIRVKGKYEREICIVHPLVIFWLILTEQLCEASVSPGLSGGACDERHNGQDNKDTSPRVPGTWAMLADPGHGRLSLRCQMRCRWCSLMSAWPGDNTPGPEKLISIYHNPLLSAANQGTSQLNSTNKRQIKLYAKS